MGSCILDRRSGNRREAWSDGHDDSRACERRMRPRRSGTTVCVAGAPRLSEIVPGGAGDGEPSEIHALASSKKSAIRVRARFAPATKCIRVQIAQAGRRPLHDLCGPALPRRHVSCSGIAACVIVLPVWGARRDYGNDCDGRRGRWDGGAAELPPARHVPGGLLLTAVATLRRRQRWSFDEVHGADRRLPGVARACQETNRCARQW